MAAVAAPGGSRSEPFVEPQHSHPLRSGTPTAAMSKQEREEGKQAGQKREANGIVVHFKVNGVNVCMWDAGCVRLMGTPFRSTRGNSTPTSVVASVASIKSRNKIGCEPQPIHQRQPSAGRMQRTRPRKKARKGKEQQRKPLQLALQRVRNHVQRIKREELLLSAYQSDGWNGASRNVVKPTAELERAREQIRRSQQKIRECVAVCDEAEGDTPMPESAFSPLGEPIIDAIGCSRCGGLAAEEKGNDIVLCDGPCRRAYHQLCLKPPITAVELQRDIWLCPACICKNEILASLNEHFDTVYSLATKPDTIFKPPEDGKRENLANEPKASLSSGQGDAAAATAASAAKTAEACARAQSSMLRRCCDGGSDYDDEVPIGAVLAGDLASEDDEEDKDFSPHGHAEEEQEEGANGGNASPSASMPEMESDSETLSVATQARAYERMGGEIMNHSSSDGTEVCSQSLKGRKRGPETCDSQPPARSKRRRQIVNYVQLDEALCRDGALREEDDDADEAAEYIPTKGEGEESEWDGGHAMD